MPKEGYCSITVTESLFNDIEQARKKLGLKSPAQTIEKLLEICK